MGILSRFKDIMESNIHAMLDKAENPEKMIDQLLRNLHKDLVTVKSETAGVMAEETRAKRVLNDRLAEMEKIDEFARKAVEAGNDGDARKFLAKKNSLAADLPAMQQMAQTAEANATNMKAMFEKLNQQIGELENRRSTAKAQMAAARTQERLNKSMGNMSATRNLDDSFAKIEQMADKANAMAQLNSVPVDETFDLMNKYGASSDEAVDGDLAALKAEMGMY